METRQTAAWPYVCEYSGISSSPVDKTATNSSAGPYIDTGTTATTSQANELWVGTTFCEGGVSPPYHSWNPTNGFIMFDGAGYQQVNVAYLEKFVTSTGAANSGITGDSASGLLGCIATFKLDGVPTGIVRVQGIARGTSTSSSVSVTMGATPTSGNVLIATVSSSMYPSGPATVSSITETGVTWTKQANNAYNSEWDAEIWYGVIGSGSSTSVSITLSATANYGAVADICEYSGLNTTTFLDKTATNGGSSAATTDTGTTATTTQTNELWIGTITTNLRYQSAPTNAFGQFDGDEYSNIGSAYLEKIVSSTGAANSGTTPSSSAYYSGCIATFKATASTLSCYTNGASHADANIVGYPNSTNWQAVNYNDGDSSYVYNSGTDEYYETYTIDTSGVPSGAAINSLTVHNWVRSASTTSTRRTYFGNVLTNSTSTYYGTSNLCPYTTYTEYTDVWTGMSYSELANVKIGIDIINRNVAYLGRCTQVYVVVDYTYTADTTKPTYSTPTTNTTIAGAACNLTCPWSDNTALDKAFLETDNTGPYINSTVQMSGTSFLANVTLSLNSTVGVVVAYRWYANDTSNNWNSTSTQYLTIVESNWLSGWNYRKKHIVNLAAGADINYAVQIITVMGVGTDTGNTVYLSSHGSSNQFYDVRFTDLTGDTLLDYWQESYVYGVNSTFWVEIAGNLTTSNQNIYVYYNKTGSQSTTSNGTATFTFFDDFSSALDWTNKWQSTNQSAYSIISSTLACYHSSGEATGHQIETITAYSGFAAQANVKGSSVSSSFYVVRCEQTSGAETHKEEVWLRWTSNRLYDYIGGTGSYVSETADTSTYYKVVYLCPTTGNVNYTIYKNEIAKISNASTPTYTTVHVGFIGDAAGITDYVQYLLIRKYVSTEPTHGTWYTEETVLHLLYVKSFSATETTWGTSGSSPYIGESTGYIAAIVATNESWFDFTHSYVYPEQVSLDVQGYIQFANPEFNITLDNGVSNATLGPYRFNVETSWIIINVTSYLSSITKLNAAKIQFVAINASIGVYSIITKCRLRLYYGGYPDIYGVTTNIASSSATFYCHYADANDNLDSFVVRTNNTGPYVNSTGTIGAQSGWGNATLTLNDTSINTVAYYFGNNDTAGHWEYTETYYLYLVWSHYNASTFVSIGSSSTAGQRHSYARSDFYSPNTGLYWVFFTNSSTAESGYANYYTSVDGSNYVFGDVVLGPFSYGGGGRIYYFLETRSGIDYIHVQESNESLGQNLVYRKGILNSNKTITWLAGWQNITSVDSSHFPATNGIATDPLGHTFLMYAITITEETDLKFYLTYTLETNGTWVTDTADGYPIYVTADMPPIPGQLLDPVAEGYIVPIPAVNSTYMAFSGMGGKSDPNPKGKMLTNNVLGSRENISDYSGAEYRRFSVVSDVLGNVHFVFAANDTHIYYSWRNYTTGLWQIKDTDLGYGGSASSYSYPVICYDEYNLQIIINWWSNDVPVRAYLKVYNATVGWMSTECIAVEPANQTLQVDPNCVTPSSYKIALFTFNYYSLDTAAYTIYGYYYTVPLPPGFELNVTFSSISSWSSSNLPLKELGLSFLSVPSLSSFPGFNHENLLFQASMALTTSILNLGQSFGNVFTSMFQASSPSVFSKELGSTFTNAFYPSSTPLFGQEFSNIFTSTLKPTALFGSGQEFTFQPFPSIATFTSMFAPSKEQGFQFASSSPITSSPFFSNEFGFTFASQPSIISIFSSSQETLFQSLSYLFTSSANPLSLFTISKELSFQSFSAPSFSSVSSVNNELLFPFASQSIWTSLFTPSKELSFVNKEFSFTFTAQPGWNSLFIPNREYISTGWPTPIMGWPIYPFGVLNPSPVSVVELYLPTVLSSMQAFCTFLFQVSYPAHIQTVCVVPSTSTVDLNVVNVYTVPSLNYTKTVTHTLNGNQSVTVDVIVPVPLIGSDTYDYHVSTTYLFGNTLIAQSTMDGVLTVQWWWGWVWTGTVTFLSLVFVGICVGAYKVRERKRKQEEVKRTIQKQKRIIEGQKKTIRDLS